MDNTELVAIGDGVKGEAFSRTAIMALQNSGGISCLRSCIKTPSLTESPGGVSVFVIASEGHGSKINIAR